MIRGLVRFPGETPPPAMIVPDPGSRCPTAIPDRQLIVQLTNRGVRHAVVALQHEAVQMAPGKAAELVNRECQWEPRVQWVPEGTGIWLSAEGAEDHFLTVYRKDLRVFDLELPAGAPRVRRPLVREGYYRVDCSRHLWERAWIYVAEHPYAAVTGTDGTFEIRNVPPGTYWIGAWHPGWEEKFKDPDGRPVFQPMEETARIRVEGGKQTEVFFEKLHPTF